MSSLVWCRIPAPAPVRHHDNNFIDKHSLLGITTICSLVFTCKSFAIQFIHHIEVLFIVVVIVIINIVNSE